MSALQIVLQLATPCGPGRANRDGSAALGAALAAAARVAYGGETPNYVYRHGGGETPGIIPYR